MTDALPILVPMDDRLDMRALQWAQHIAAKTGNQVRVVSIVNRPELSADRHRMIKDAVDDEAVDIVVILHDDVAATIVEAAVAASVVCMTTAATLLPHSGHFGSIAEEVVRTLAQPVVLFGPHAAPDLEVSRVVVPVDGSPAGEFIVDAAGQFANTLGAEVWVVTVETAEQQAMVSAVAGVDAGAIESGYVRRVARSIADTADSPPQFEVLHGADPAAAILDFADPDGIVAMSTHGRSGLRRVFAGSVTTKVVADAKGPTLVVRPPADVLGEG